MNTSTKQAIIMGSLILFASLDAHAGSFREWLCAATPSDIEGWHSVTVKPADAEALQKEAERMCISGDYGHREAIDLVKSIYRQGTYGNRR